jgi:hypothetical protein
MKEEIVRQSAAIKPINIAAKSLVQFSRASIAMNATVKTILSTNEHAKLNSFITEHSQFHSSWRQLHQCIDPLFSFLDRHLKDKIKSVADNYAAVKVDFDHCGIHFARVVLAGVLESEARVLRFEIANFKLSWLDRYDVTLMATPPEIERRAGREIHIVAKRLIDMPSHLSYLLPINQNTTLVDICACEFYGPGKFADIDNLEDLIPLSRAKVLRFTFYPIDTNSAEALPNTLENSSKLVEIKLNSYHQHMKRSAETMLEHFYGTL